MKILGSLYATSDDPEKSATAKVTLPSVMTTIIATNNLAVIIDSVIKFLPLTHNIIKYIFIVLLIICSTVSCYDFLLPVKIISFW